MGEFVRKWSFRADGIKVPEVDIAKRRFADEIVALQLKREKFLNSLVKLLSGRMIRPFAGGDKNVAADARRIWTAVQPPGVKAWRARAKSSKCCWRYIEAGYKPAALSFGHHTEETL